MGLILTIETSTKGCSVALHHEGSLLSNSELFSERSTSEMLTTLITEVLENANVSKDDLVAVAVSKGPGSYTGLRIGVSTAKGLCFGLDIPLISYNTLEGMAHQFPAINDYLLCPMLDARRMEVYCAFYDSFSKSEIHQTSAEIINSDSFLEILASNKVVFFGDGASKCESIIQSPNAKFISQIKNPTAGSVGLLVFRKYIKREFEDLVLFEPYYLKEFMATVPKKQKML